MVLHELATNATKHGAWSTGTGTVTLDWSRIDRAGRTWLRLIWRETGGPAVQVPGRKGFGSRLIEQSLAGAGGRTTVKYDASGIVCELECPCL
jgi:two-component sensor histidine kinase